MKKYTEVKNLHYAAIAQEVLSFWQNEGIFEKSITQREGEPTFTFYEGPPSANGAPGIHHVMARTIKDIFCRYQTLKGKQVARKGGWDTHGLPIELQVEKELGITKEDIGKKISIEAYNQKCRETVMRFKTEWEDLTQKMGYWVDLQDPYITFDNKYIETLWHLLKRLYDKGFLYKGYTIQPYSPAAGTGLSSHELNQPGCYREVKDLSMMAQFKVKGKDNEFLLAWTTTPWTLPSNTALAVGKDIEYIKVETHNQYTKQPISIIFAKALINKVLTPDRYVPHNEYDEEKHKNKHPYIIVEQFKGSHLLGLKYEQLLPYVQPLENAQNAFQVIAGDFVSTEDGTGIVHIAPTFGADDFRVARENDVPPLLVLDENGQPMPLVDKSGRFVKEVTDFAGRAVKSEYEPDEVTSAEGYESTDLKIALKLKAENRAFKIEKYEHNYPHCWRTDKPILYYPLASWFIATTKVKEKLIVLNKTINWKPESTGTGRFGNWLENLVDWNLSRSRYWGTPLPIWRNETGTQEICIGSVEQLITEMQAAQTSSLLSEVEKQQNAEILEKYQKQDGFDLHRPYADRITLVREGEKLYRETDLIDVWFDSGAMPYAQWHYPFENQGIFEKNYPADFIAEGVDQTRGWFFTLHALAVMLGETEENKSLFGGIAFKNVISNGLVLDKNGNKMSKRLGNAVDPFQTLSQYGADPTRWYMVENANPWDNLRFNLDGVTEVQRKFFGTLQNTYNFFAIYANLDNWTYSAEKQTSVQSRTELDRWISSKLNSLIAEVDGYYADYEPTKVARAIQDFVCDQLSNWYVRLCRKRYWVGEMTQDKHMAYETLYECLLAVSQLMSPIAPFFADWLYQNLTETLSEKDVQILVAKQNNRSIFGHPSIHLSYWQNVDKSLIDKDLERQVELSQQISSMTHALRKRKQIRVRQPLEKIMVAAPDEATKVLVQKAAPIILSEVNVKSLEFIPENSELLVKKIKPNFRKLGGQYGKQMPQIAAFINKMTPAQIRTAEQTGVVLIKTDSGEPIILTLEEVEIASQDVEGWLVAAEAGITVALDVTISETLKEEGVARDFVNRIQNLRKEKGLEVQDKIKLKVQLSGTFLNQALQNHQAYICQEVQALALDLVENVENGEEVEVEEGKFVLEMAVSK
ncbi:isoleucine--tRNA ligase [Hugenholtzia roseola]|uniref:isoleucine--tRNA ligase n=1 Tax=Hugenholtzia roseola TaxID=1002 RepID=UPI0003FA9E28|nr:isoleucine--tRNA ligase [Hugenholtzia roseola]